jgi:hypothetical protein
VDAIVLDRLTKSYGRERGVVDLSFTVAHVALLRATRKRATARP